AVLNVTRHYTLLPLVDLSCLWFGRNSQFPVPNPDEKRAGLGVRLAIQTRENNDGVQNLSTKFKIQRFMVKKCG
ncbi:hypothetical protein, partial [Acinetobacter baumannii]|uniref:hypothetical protein n=1 Tax=Acinetobacter baumannii TaxID=470 RepID=UPI00339097FF